MMDKDAATTIALEALAHIVSEENSRDRFLALSGFSGPELRAAAQEPWVLAGVLDFLLAEEPLLLAFCEARDLAPEMPLRARRALPGGHWEG